MLIIRRSAKVGLGCAAALILAAVGVRVGGRVLARRALARFSERAGEDVTAGAIDSRLGRLRLRDVRVGDRVFAREVVVDYDLLPLLALRVQADVRARGAAIRLRPDDGRPHGAGAAASGRVRLRSVALRESTVGYTDPLLGVEASARLDATWRHGERTRATLTDVLARLRAGPEARAERVNVIQPPPSGGGGASAARAEVHGGSIRIWAGLRLSGVTGWLASGEDGGLGLALAGSYGGAAARLWEASGWIKPATREAEVRVRAERFHLDRLAGVLAKLPIVDLEHAEVGGDLTLRRSGDRFTFEGEFAASGLTLFGEKIGPVAVPGLAAEATLRGTFDPRHGRLLLDEAIVRYAGVTAVIDGRVERLGQGALLDARLRVPTVPCAAALAALPAPLVPKLAGLRVAGHLEADVRTHIDFAAIDALRDAAHRADFRQAALDAVALDADIGIDGCRVTGVPPELDVRRLAQSFTQTAEITPGHGLVIVVGPENPDFVPLAEVSPYLVAAVLTTEDTRFLEHRGFIPHEFRTALARNLAQGRFAFGASSITMQMVKNVLLSPEKTLARKLQELVLTWYVEQHLDKERILEIYLNAIEFGPGLFGIGRAARHYFGKHPRDLTPIEAVFMTSILPNPKARFEYYCRGRLSARKERHVARILARMHERERLTDAEYEEAQAEDLVFDRAYALEEDECMRRLHRMIDATPEAPLARLELPYRVELAEPDAAEGFGRNPYEEP